MSYVGRYQSNPVTKNQQLPTEEPVNDVADPSVDQWDPLQESAATDGEANELDGLYEDNGVDDIFSDSEESQPLTEKQQRLARKLEEMNQSLQKKISEAQNAYGQIVSGEGTLEEQEKRVKAVETILNQLQSELALHDSKEAQLEKSGLKEEELLPDSAIGEEFVSQLEELKGTIGTERKTVDAAKKKEEEQAALEAKKKAREAQEKQVKLKAKDEILAASEHLGEGSTEPTYYTKWEGDSVRAKDVMSSIATALEDGDWTVVTSTVQSISAKDADESLSLVAAVLTRFVSPTSLEKIPYKTLDEISNCIKKGNKPGKEQVKCSEVKGPKAKTLFGLLGPLGLFGLIGKGKTGISGNEYASTLHDLSLQNKKLETAEAEKRKAENEALGLPPEEEIDPMAVTPSTDPLTVPEDPATT